MVIELYYGHVERDDDGNDFYLNGKENLPVIVKPGKRVKKTFKSGTSTLKMNVVCDRGDQGGFLEGEYERIDETGIPNPDPLYETQRGKFTKGTDTVGLGQTVVRGLEQNIGYKIIHRRS